MFIKKIEKESLLKPLLTVIGIVERKQTLPILSNVLIEKTGGEIRFTSTDLEIQITTTIICNDEDSKSLSITVGAKKFHEILRILPEQSIISIESNDNKIEIKTKNSKFRLQTLPFQDFPKLSNQLQNPIKIKLSQKKLKKLFLSIQFAMAQQDVRYYLNGALLIIEKNRLKVVATDGHRLAYNEIDIDENYERQDIILPRKAIIELCKLLGDNNESIEIEISPQQVKACFSGITLITKVIDGKFPDYKRVIPKYINQLIINRIQIQQALQRVALLSNEKFRGVRFVLTEKKLTVISSNSEQEEAQEEIETSYHAEAIDIGFNIHYLIDVLNNIEGDEITFSFGDPNSSLLITTEKNPEFSYVVMPMRI